MHFPKDFTLIDLETTGLSPNTCDIIEVGGIKVRDNEVIDEYNSLIKIPYSIPPRITMITGIDDHTIRNAPGSEEVLSEFVEFIENDIVLAHNAPFDRGFMRSGCYNYLDRDFGNDFIDTVKLARSILPHLNNHKLQSLLSYYSIDCGNAHRAIDDCRGTLELYFNLKRDAGY